MAESDDTDGKKNTESNSGITEDLTATAGDTGYGDSDRLRIQHLKTLLGPAALRTNVEIEFLVKIELREGAQALLEQHVAKIGNYPNFRSPSADDMSCVVGPVKESQLREWVDEGLITAAVQIQKPFDRWKEIGTVFPEWIFKMPLSEDTQTGEFGMEGDDRENTRSVRDLTRETDIAQSPPALPAAAGFKIGNQRVAQERNSRESDPQRSNRQLLVVGLAVLAMVAALYAVTSGRLFKKAPPKVEDSVASAETAVKEVSPFAGAVPEQQWPASLKPLSYEEVKSAQVVGTRSVAPVLSAFERGMRALDQTDSAILKRASDPGAASFEGRKVASNLLAAFLFLDQDSTGTRKILERTRDQDPKDAVTLINLGLLEYSEHNYDDAIENFKIVYRLKRDTYDWLMSSLIGLALFEQGKAEEAGQVFRDAVQRRPGHPMIYGLWLKGILSSRKITSTDVSDLIIKGLWSDHDITRDSPLPAPIFIPYIDALYEEGWTKALKYVGTNLSAGKRMFVEWLQERNHTSGKLLSKWNDLREYLVKDNDSQSKILLAYLLKESGRLEEAADILLKSVEDLGDGRDVEGSWPWSFAGEVQLSRGYFGQATQFFNKALAKNQTDAAALNGLAVISRALGSYATAETKFIEASSLDQFFIPAKMRVSRLKWQDRLK